jgi:hypothetical protein
VYLAERLGLQVDDTGFEDTAYAQGAELTDVELVELEAAKGRNKKVAESGPVEEPRCIITTKMATAFPEVSSEMARFFKSAKRDSYRDIYEKIKVVLSGNLSTVS